MAGNAARTGHSVTSRAPAILGAFDGRHRRLGLTELAEPGRPLRQSEKAREEDFATTVEEKYVAARGIGRGVPVPVAGRPAATGRKNTVAGQDRAGRECGP